LAEGYALIYFIYCVVIPGFFVGLIVGFLRFKRLGASILVGLFFAIVVAPIVLSIIIPATESLEKTSLEKDAVYFKSSLIGKYTDDEIKQHYNRHPLSYSVKNTQWIDSILDDSFKTKPITKRIILLAEITTKEDKIVETLALLPNAPIALKLRAASTNSSYVANNMAKDLNTTSEILIELAVYQSNIETENLLLDHPNAIQTLRDIIAINRSNREDNSINTNRYKATKHAQKYVSTSKITAWKYLANHKDPRIVRNIAKSMETPPEILNFIANNNSNEVVLASVFLSKKCTQQSKQLILKRFPGIVSFLILESAKSDSELKVDIAASPEATLQMHDNLIKHAYSNFHEVFYAIAKNPKITPDILLKLADQGYPDVQKLVAKNPITPRAALVKLSNSADSDVASTAKLNLIEKKLEMPLKSEMR